MENNENHEALLKHLEIQWQDHIQTRKQTWEALKISAILAVALVGLDWRVDHPIVTIVTSGLLAAVALFGMQILFAVTYFIFRIILPPRTSSH